MSRIIAVNPWRGLGVLPREMWLLSLATLINRAGTMVLPFLVLYLTRDRGFSAAEAGLVLTLYGLSALVTAPFSGHLSDRLGPLVVMQGSLILSGVLLFAFPRFHSFPSVVGVTVVWSAISEALRPAALSLISHIVTPEHRKAGFALNRLAINLGMSIGPAAGGFLLLISYPLLFIVDGATAILAGLLLVFIPWRLGGKGAAPETPGGDTVRHLPAFRDPVLVYFLASYIPVVFVFFQHESGMPLFLVRDLGFQESVYGMLFTVNTGLIILLEVPLNLAMHAWPHRRVLSTGALLVAVGFGAMAIATSLPAIVATVVIWTFGEMILFPGGAAYMADVAPPARRGEYMGLFQMSFSFAFAISALAGPAILDGFGAQVLWGSMFVAAAASGLMFLRVRSVNLS